MIEGLILIFAVGCLVALFVSIMMKLTYVSKTPLGFTDDELFLILESVAKNYNSLSIKGEGDLHEAQRLADINRKLLKVVEP